LPWLLFLAHKLFNTKALMVCPRNKFGSNINISTFTVENMASPGKYFSTIRSFIPYASVFFI